MAKTRNSNSIPTSNPDFLGAVMQSSSTSIEQPSVLPLETPVIRVEVPIEPNFPPSEFMVHLDVRLTLEQSTVVRRIARQLDRQQAFLKNGQRVVNNNSAVKWLLECIGQEL